MKVGTEDKKKLMTALVLGFFAILAIGYLGVTLFGGPPSTPPPAAPATVAQPLMVPKGGKVATAAAGTPAGAAAVKLGTVSGELDPTLHMDAMLAAESLVYSGSGRNVFAPGPLQAPSQVKAEQAKFNPRNSAIVPMAPINLGPPPPPPINLKFFGVATRRGVRQALLLSGDDVFLAAAGDIVARRYKIVSISANSIAVQDLPNSNQQNLPLVAN